MRTFNIPSLTARFVATTAAACALIAAAPAYAAEMPAGERQEIDVIIPIHMDLDAAKSTIGRGESVNVIPMVTTLSEPGESKDAFVMRLAQWFRNFTVTSGYEACGTLASASDGRFGIVITTSHSQVGCAVAKLVPDGFVATDETVHSHPVQRRLTASGNDRAFAQAASNSSRRVARQFRVSGNPERFSRADFAAGPGYLVTATRVMHQRGAGNVREVGLLPPLAEAAE